jgi:hypothetical protein
LHEDEEEANQPGAETKATTPKSKWENFLYYHKVHMIIGFCVILLAGFLIHDLTSKVNPDYQIALITQQSYPEEMTEALQNQIAKYGEDLNSDGKVVVQISNYVVADDTDSGKVDLNMQAAGVTRLSADFQTGGSMLFITDDASFKNQQQRAEIFSYLNGSVPKDGATDYQNMRVSLKDCKKLSTSINGMENLSISLRIYKGSQIEGQKGMDSYFSASKKLLEKITAK